MRERWRGKLALWSLLAVTALVITGLYVASPTSPRTEPEQVPVRVDVVPVQYRAGNLPVVLEGVASAADQVAVLAEVSGAVVERPEYFRNGSVVEAGQLLLALDPHNYELALAERRSQVSAARLHLADTRARASVARRGNANSGNAYARLEPHLEEAQARLAAAEAGLARAQRDLASTRVVAPFRGRLAEVRASPGQFVRAGETLAVLSSVDRMEVRLPLRDEWLALLDLPLAGDAGITPLPVLLHGRFAGREVSWSGQIVRREGGVDRNRMIYLVASVEAADAGPVPLEPGVLVRAEMQGRHLDALARLPRSVLNNDGSVWLVDDAQRLRRRKVQLLHQDEQHVYVGSGLQSGDRVAVNGSLRWLEGARVVPREQSLAMQPSTVVTPR